MAKQISKKQKKELIKKYYSLENINERDGYNTNFYLIGENNNTTTSKILSAVAFILILKNNEHENLKYKYIKSNKEEFLPILKTLINEDKILYMSPYNDIEQFVFNKNTLLPDQYYLLGSEFYVSIDLDEYLIECLAKDNLLYELISEWQVWNHFNKEYFSENHEDLNIDFDVEKIIKDLYICLQQIMGKSILSQFNKYLNERNINGYEETPDKYKEFINLFNELSYTQIAYYAWAVARDVGDKVTTHTWSRTAAQEYALQQIAKYYERAKKNGWECKHAEYPKYGNILITLLEILKLNLDDLKEVLTYEKFSSKFKAKLKEYQIIREKRIEQKNNKKIVAVANREERGN